MRPLGDVELTVCSCWCTMPANEVWPTQPARSYTGLNGHRGITHKDIKLEAKLCEGSLSLLLVTAGCLAAKLKSVLWSGEGGEKHSGRNRSQTHAMMRQIVRTPRSQNKVLAATHPNELPAPSTGSDSDNAPSTLPTLRSTPTWLQGNAIRLKPSPPYFSTNVLSAG